MAPSPAPVPVGASRRAFLAASAGVALLAAGCTAGGPAAPAVGTEEADRLADQVAVQEAVVAAYAAARTADPALALSDLAAQAGEQLDRLRAAAPPAPPSPAGPSSPGSPAAGSAAGSAAAPPAAPAGGDVRGWLRDRLATAAASHAQACTGQSGARAALLGSVAAGLRGHEAALA
ncbi:hypothetical protein [Geodermatophilus sp. DSM 44513]|uniref:hypothetical protein n=1 Tax=Geodermatophilus sp. DSM 44513 TaxID=1528104 RepID=UPI001274934A|nr:hypothetical protein [Geodermatophilus sp. DSM 44513]WNV74424.1 hypothetical protein RTG05_15710 [Geodermatophilus sp. DSM 44513]